MKPDLDRLWKKIDVRGPDECWPWLGRCLPSGYPQIGKHQYVHRLIAGAKVGEVVRHTCDNPSCCNRRHLVKGTQKQNLQDMVDRGRSNKGERHWNCRLTAAQVEAIRCDPRSSSQVAQDYPVKARTIRKIRQGARW